MITDSREYELFLSNIAETAPSILKMRVPSDEKIYQINLNTRKVESPSFIGVNGDHSAEFIFFEMDRFYEMMDLADTIGIVLIRNANNEEFYQLIPYYDIYSDKNKIIFPWTIQAPTTSKDGTVSFSFKFFKIDPTSQKLVYELNTAIAKTKVLVGWAKTDMENEEQKYLILNPESVFADAELLNKLNLIKEAGRYEQIYWIDLDVVPPEDITNSNSYKHMLNAALPHVHGIYRNSNFYDSDNQIIPRTSQLIYVDDSTQEFYYFDGNNFVLIDPNE